MGPLDLPAELVRIFADERGPSHYLACIYVENPSCDRRARIDQRVFLQVLDIFPHSLFKTAVREKVDLLSHMRMLWVCCCELLVHLIVRESKEATTGVSHDSNLASSEHALRNDNATQSIGSIGELVDGCVG